MAPSEPQIALHAPVCIHLFLQLCVLSIPLYQPAGEEYGGVSLWVSKCLPSGERLSLGMSQSDCKSHHPPSRLPTNTHTCFSNLCAGENFLPGDLDSAKLHATSPPHAVKVLTLLCRNQPSNPTPTLFCWVTSGKSLHLSGPLREVLYIAPRHLLS